MVFATSSIAARRIGANELNTEFEYIESCRRMPWADQYADSGKVPPLELIADGWRFECGHCYELVGEDSEHYDEESDEYIPHEPVAEGQCIYCSPACRDAEMKERAERKAKKESAKQTAEQQYPGVEVKWVDDSEPAKVSFTFPGGKHPVHWTVGESFVMVTKIDTEAWEAFKASLGVSA
ncbi:hypothetical protein D3C71_1628540 [compost metagenome]